MRTLSLRLAAALLAGTAAARALPAQRPAPPEPARPRLAAGADTNDPRAYFEEGRRLMERTPQDAALAFYWAARMAPDLAEAYYARRVALLVAREPRELLEYWRGARKTRESAEVLRIDSLDVRAYELNPLHQRKQDARLVRAVFRALLTQRARQEGISPNALLEARSEMEHYMETELQRATPDVRGMFALSEGRAPAAVAAYREAVKQAPKSERADALASLGRAWAQMGRPDSAVATFEQALADLRARDGKTTVRWYASKATLEHSVGLLYERMGRDSAAREAYGRALQEDLAYHPAHLRLAALALTHADTAQAVSELELAVQLREQDGYLHYALATALVAAGRADQAFPHLLRARELEPWFAAPHVLLARLYDASSMTDDATRAYRDFLARAPHDDPWIATARERLAKLETAPAGS